PVQHVGAAGRDRDDRQVARGIEHGGEKSEERRALGGLRNGEDLLELVDWQQHGGRAGVADTRASCKLGKLIDRLCTLQLFMPFLPSLRFPEIVRERLGERLERRLL